MDKDMAGAFPWRQHVPVNRLKGTGIKLLVTEKRTGEVVNYGIQLNNTTLEIEALPDLNVEIEGYKEMAELLLRLVNDGWSASISMEAKEIIQTFDLS